MNKLSLKTACVLLITGMIGSAIFSLSGLTILYAGPSSVLSYIIAAIIELFYGLAVAELATTYKKSGGGFVFAAKTFDGKLGRIIGYINTWGLVFADVISISFAAFCVSTYLCVIFPQLKDFSLFINLISLVICLLINFISIVSTSKFNNILGMVLIFVLLFYSFSIVYTGNFNKDNLIPFFIDEGLKGVSTLKALPIAIVGYSTITTISFLAGEIENQKKNIPLAIIISISVVAFIYSLVIFLTVSAVKLDVLLENNMLMAPLMCVTIMKLSNIPLLKELISIAAIFALLTTSIVVIAVSGRNLKAAADIGMLPKIFKKTLKTKTPVASMVVVTILSAVPLFFGNFIETMVNEATIFVVVSIIVNFICLYFTRKKYPNGNDSFRAPFSNLFLLILIIILITLNIPNFISGGVKLIIITLIWYIIGFIFYKLMGNLNGE